MAVDKEQGLVGTPWRLNTLSADMSLTAQLLTLDIFVRAVCAIHPGPTELLGAILRSPGGARGARVAGQGEPVRCCRMNDDQHGDHVEEPCMAGHA